LRILVSGFLIRYPVGGFSWHHLQYLAGLQRLGHQVTYVEHYGWPDSCYEPACDVMTADPTYGIEYLRDLLGRCGLEIPWCYLDGGGRYRGMERAALTRECRECDLYLNLSNINWIPELEECRCRVLVDTDPVFTQIGAHGLGGPFSRYHALFTYGENVHKPGCEMPTGGVNWMPTRQPVVLDLWPDRPADADAPFTSVMNWSAYGEHEHAGRRYGQKDREFMAYFSIPQRVSPSMNLAVNAPGEIRRLLAEAGWCLADPRAATKTPWSYQDYIARSRAEFSVAKHGYVSTHSGWFSDRSCGYLAMGRPVILQDTGFSDFLPCGEGLLAFRNPDEATAAILQVHRDYERHARAARAIVAEYFNADRVLTDLLARTLDLQGKPRARAKAH
jgi:hypothetical protein